MSSHAENIYNLIPRQEAAAARPPKHQSRFKSTVKDQYAANRFAHKTMGEAQVPTAQPNEFLKKHTRETKPPAVVVDPNEHDRSSQPRRPPVPKANEAPPVMGIKTKKNFIAQNAVENILSVAKKPEKNLVDSRKGDKFSLDPSGLEPVYRNRKDYGEVPEYLKKRADEIRRAQEEYDNYVKEMRQRGAMQQLTDEERQAIVFGLKKNWEDLHHQYQSLSVMTDTVPKKNRKERIESEMKQLERDIELMERHQVIYLAN
ncbi:hypothetical protein BOX15_Mlig006351g1 [Macrostomum lignano]|uniref:Enkurin domain-containing protein n=1 Tax=Macrostomum lignano TaxID=282301 RepID=A0A267FGZ2_9PLAT|nr:hypothetical protein BOX15_Mlig006351g1 [Macrostomum lignano]